MTTAKLLFVFTLLLTSFSGYSQHGQITVSFIGNAGLYMTDGKQNVYIDFPYKSGAYGYMKYDQAAVDNIKDNSTFIFTHRHADHYSKKLLRKLKGKTFGPWNSDELEKQSYLIDFSVKAFKTKHRFCLKHNSYLVTWHGKRIFISGDTETADTIATGFNNFTRSTARDE